MNIHFTGAVEDLQDGIAILSGHFGVRLTEEGFPVELERHDKNLIEVIKKENGAVIRYHQNIHLFRAFGLLVEGMAKNDYFTIVEEPQFTTLGTMIDVSQGNAVITVNHVKKILTHMAAMGLNMLMIYSEDSYEMEDEPFFGYMRSKYSRQELKELDDFAFSLGIEMIPCIQTLAHLVDALKWSEYYEIRQDLDILLLGQEKTYQFIEKMIDNAAAPFRSKRIHLGMDEAWKLGQGKYLSEHGYRDKFELMTEHLNRVSAMVQNKGLQPMIWSDMYFHGGGYKGAEDVKEEIIAAMPHGVRYIFWDYFETEQSFFTETLAKHQKFTDTPIFAGGIISWMGYGVNYDRTFQSSDAALNACKQCGVQDVFVTIWGDDTVESIIDSNLLGMQLYAEHGYASQLDVQKLKARFEFCNHVRYEDFRDFNGLEVIAGAPEDYVKKENNFPTNLSKYLMWQDILLGMFDKNIEGLSLNEHYEALALKMGASAKRNDEFGYLFAFQEKVCSVLSVKAELGLNIAKHYREKNVEMLSHIAHHVLPDLAGRVVALKDDHRKLWMKINKPMGWEVLDLRYGALFMRIDTARDRLLNYLSGEINRIEELEQERLYFHGEKGLVLNYVYNTMPTASRISMTTFFTPWE